MNIVRIRCAAEDTSNGAAGAAALIGITTLQLSAMTIVRRAFFTFSRLAMFSKLGNGATGPQ